MKRVYGTLAALYLAVILMASSCAMAPKVEITSGEFIDHVRILAADNMKGRATGSPELMEAARYIRSQFRSAGLEPGGETNYFQYFSVTVGSRFGADNGLRLAQGEREQILSLGEEYMPVSFGGKAGENLPLVFAGYGITAPEAQYDDYEGLDVAGKAVLVFALEPQRTKSDSPLDGVADTRHAQVQTKVLNARKHGAAALLIVRGPLHAGEGAAELPAMSESYNVEEMGIPALLIASQPLDRCISGSGLDLAKMQQDIEADFKPLSAAVEGVVVNVAVDVKPVRRRAVNVIGKMRGREPELTDEAIIVGAHFDHIGLGYGSSMSPGLAGQIHNGADDNASGTAALIEIAEYLNLNLRDSRRSIYFVAFAGEEMGLLGSTYFIENSPVPPEKIIAMVNMDMVGRLRDGNLLVGGVGTAEPFQRIVDDAAKSYPFHVNYDRSGLGAGDHAAFSLKKIPILFFFSGVHEDYHRPSDDWEKINSEGGAEIARLVADVVRKIDALERPPAFVEVEQKAVADRRGGGRPWFGSVPDFSYQGEGYRFQAVTAGSPAEKAGLKAGDILVEFGGAKVGNIYDYTSALQNYQPGDTVEVVVLRDGESLQVQVTLEDRQ